MFKEIDDISISNIQVILEEGSPSLLSCTNKCLHHNAEVNFDPPYCRCFVIRKNSLKDDDGKVETLPGLFYEVNFNLRWLVNTFLGIDGLTHEIC